MGRCQLKSRCSVINLEQRKANFLTRIGGKEMRCAGKLREPVFASLTVFAVGDKVSAESRVSSVRWALEERFAIAAVGN